MKESIWQQNQMKTEDTTTKHAAFYAYGHFDTNDRYPSKCIATSLIRHLGYLDKVGKSNERTTSWRFSDDMPGFERYLTDEFISTNLHG
jgi:hypothetical protein